MKVLMFGWEFPPHISGGLGTACFGITTALATKNVNITFVIPKLTSTPTNASCHLIGAENIIPMNEKVIKSQIKHISKYIEVPSILTPYLNDVTYKERIEQETKESVFSFSGNYGGNLMEEVVRYSAVGKKLGAKKDFDIIHAHDWMTFLAGIEAKKASGKKLIVHVHSTEYDRSGNNPQQDIFNIEQLGMETADTVITVSERMKNLLNTKYGISNEKIHVVYNAVTKDDLSAIEPLWQFKKRPDEKFVTFLGRITMQKGPEYFIDACKIVADKLPNVRFIMAGSGDMAKKMILKMASLDLTSRFHFTGFLKPLEREHLFNLSDLYIMPSVSEPFGITPLEAIKHNVPVIVSHQSGIAEILEHAKKVDFWNVQELSSAMIDILTNDKVTRQMVENNRKCLDQIDWKHVADHIISIYHM
ncbi:MAG: hypothetical protein A2381_07845 [Bdellovibrionales bacterium RIFOXYB1_FULL_37_110]|nr:MAG: hypothetical protein A2181_04610 [Bdellovibrionales bacterium RIFOXYA1_FULL_38_20]OFZ52516.1 MAG: hypothetical protein A2417_00565 [Bdellovibrionales bacterium RIFOXYC1_FULL_37_79]OFZ59718.1 MAG: hypothetical protein A2381_07845 [Bdellovibrionales bacterium RIFOXYB1_FULL_37_110]OFZ62645.1 MAG: hypothetical protein A2577_12165 [Bdellovibrionales bacterium RIFOXYD1_FULL_36_51]